MIRQYDYIICGAGCAGLFLAFYLSQSNQLKNKSILIIDKDNKQTNDRTWCFWDQDKTWLDSISTKQWKKLKYNSDSFQRILETAPFSYKMVRSIDFYDFIIKEVKKHCNIYWKKDSVLRISQEKNKSFVSTVNHDYSSNYVFNSTPLLSSKVNNNERLLQHFLGWFIELETDFFDDNIGTLMDFDLDQTNGTTFMYVLPINKRKALVEYTLFSENTLNKTIYTNELKKYIKEKLQINQYKISHQEFGVIPMINKRINNNIGKKIIQIGLEGGYAKASSGYAFQFIHQNIKKIVSKLEKGESPIVKSSISEKIFQWYDFTLLNVLISKELEGKKIMNKIFKNSKPESVFAFLSNKSSLSQDISIMRRLPVKVFLKHGLKALTKIF